MDLIINSLSVYRSSYGVRKYVAGILEHLSWPGSIQELSYGKYSSVDRIKEIFARGNKNAIFWTPCQRGPLWAYNHIVTVHDCINVEYKYKNDWRLKFLLTASQKVFDNAARIVAISNSTKEAILRNYRVRDNKIVTIISPRITFNRKINSDDFINDGVKKITEQRQRPFVLIVTNAARHKNTKDAAIAMSKSGLASRNIEVRVVGSLESAAVEILRRNDVIFSVESNVTEQRLLTLYRECLFYFSPSLSEGHNLTIAEARSMGANVLCSDIPAHREFYSGEVRFFDPTSIDSMISAIDYAIQNEGKWLAVSPESTRSFSTVAKEYNELFLSIK